MIDVVIAFDVEDPIYEEDDEAILRLCRIHAEEGVIASLFVAGEKARVLRQRGRHDVIAAMRDHEICHHGNYWGDFPQPALEYGQEMSWDEAVQFALGVELPGLHDVAEITGQFPVAWCCHQAQQSPPLQYAFKLAGVRCWAGGPRGWIMNWLSWPRSNCTISSQGSWSQRADPTQRDRQKPPCDPGTDICEIQMQFDAMEQRTDFITLVGHPACWVTSDWDWADFSVLFRHRGRVYYPRPAYFSRSQLRSLADTEAAYELTRRLLRWLKSRPDVNLTTYSQLCEKDEEDPVQWLTMEQTLSFARRMRSRLTYYLDFGTSFSPADMWGLLTFACSYCWHHGKWPNRLPVQRLNGLTDTPFMNTGAVTLTREHLFAGALAGYTLMMDERRVPGVLRAGHTDIGPGTCLCALADFVTQSVETGSLPSEVAVEAMNDLPEAVNEPAIQDRRFGSSNHGPGLTYDRLWDLLRWQAWSYRPAVRRT